MGMDQLLPSFLDEFSKIAASSRVAGYLQARKGRRPIRAETLLKKDTTGAQKEEKEDGINEPDESEREGGLGLLEDPSAVT
jgi:hypothetical protein